MNKTHFLSICLGIILLWLTPFISAACLNSGDCTCIDLNLGNTNYFLPNGTNQTFTCSYTCTDTDGSCATLSGCVIRIQKSFSGVATTLDAGPTEGTSTLPLFCGGQTCGTTAAKGSNPTLLRNISAVRTNTTNAYANLRCYTDLPGASATGFWIPQYITSPGNPNMTSFKWYDGSYPYVNGTNQSSRNAGNLTCFESPIQSDGTVVNTSLWANFSSNGSNSTTFRLIDRNVSAGLTNSTARFCVNITNGADGATSWNNISVALCANTNTTTGATTRYGMSCKSFAGPTWITSGTSMSTANSVGTFNWFNVSWPNAGAADPCAPTGAWTVSTTITCTNVNITVDTINITETGSLTLRNVTLRSSNIYVTDSGPLGGKGRLSYENTTFDGSQAWWLNGNLTIGGRVNISGVKLYLNGTADGMAGINNTNTGYLFIRGNATNITAGETTTNGYFWWNDYGSNLSVQDATISYAGASQGRYQRGIVINTTAVNMTRVKVYDGYEGLTYLDWSNDTNASYIDIQRITSSGVTVRYAKGLNLSIFNDSLSGGGFSLITDGMVVEHGNISSHSGDAVGGNGVQNFTLIDINMTDGSQSGIGIANVKNLTIIASNITSNAWHGISGYTMNDVWIHDTNTSGNGQSGIGINYDQLTAQTTSKSNKVWAYNSTITDNIILQGSINLTTWNTTTNTVTFGTCTICNVTVTWPLSLWITDDWGAQQKNYRFFMYGRDQSENKTNTTGASGYVRYLNVTEYSRYAATTYVWVSNHTINASRTNYTNRTMSLNVSGPNETIVNLTYDPCVVPQDNWTLPNWVIPMPSNCELRNQHRAGKIDFITLSGSGNVTCTNSNYSFNTLNISGDFSVPRNITLQTGCNWHFGGEGT